MPGALIAAELIEQARTRELHGLGGDPVIFGLECGRADGDRATLAIRCGRDARSRAWRHWQGKDVMTLAGDVALQAALLKPDAIFVAAGAVGAAVIDRLRQLGVSSVFAVRSEAPGRDMPGPDGAQVKTADKRAEMWLGLRDWLADGAAIPGEAGLAAALADAVPQRAGDRVSIGGGEAAVAEALALSFAEPVMSRALPAWLDPVNYGRAPGTRRLRHGSGRGA